MKKIVVVGCGGLAKEAKWVIDQINSVLLTWDFCGFVVNESCEKTDIFGNDYRLEQYEEKIAVVLAIANPRIREELFNRFKLNKNLYFPNIIAPHVMMSNTNIMGEGNLICAGNLPEVDIRIGNCNVINQGCTIGHDTVLGDFNVINPLTSISGNVHIGNRCEIGTRTAIIQGISISDDVVVGAGAVVIRDINHSCTVVGVPAKELR